MGVSANDNGRAKLSFAETVLLWSMRAWVLGLARSMPVAEKIEAVCAKIGAPDAAIQIYEFMWIIGHGAARVVAVDCVCVANVSVDERALLDVVALSQRDRSFEALVLLRGMVTPTAARAAVRAAEEVGLALLAAGHRLPAPVLPTARYVMTGGTA